MISVVIPAFNEEHSIALCLQGLVMQSTDQKFEVILVDNASTDNTTAVAKTFQKKLNLRIIHEPFKSRGAARSSGFACARGTIILSTDADTIVPSEWIDILVNTMQVNQCAAVTGSCYISEYAPILNSLFYIFQTLHMHAYRLLFGHYWLSGFNFAITKDAYIASGGFNKQLTALEDIDISFKVSKFCTITYTSSVPVLVSARRFRNGIARGAWSYYSSFWEYYVSKKEPVLADIR